MRSVRVGIRGKLFGSFGVLVGLLVIIAAVTMASLADVETQLSAITDYRITQLGRVGEVTAYLSPVRRLNSQITRASDPEAVEAASGTTSSRGWASSSACWASYSRRAMASRTARRWRPSSKPGRSRGSSKPASTGCPGRRPRGRHHRQPRWTGATNAVEEKLRAMATQRQEQSREAAATARAAAGRARTLAVGIGALAILFAIGAAYLLTRSLTRTLGQVATTARQLATTDFPAFVGVTNALAAGDSDPDVCRHSAAGAGDKPGRDRPDGHGIQSSHRGPGRGPGAFAAMRTQLSTLVGEVQRSATHLAATSDQLGQATSQQRRRRCSR